MPRNDPVPLRLDSVPDGVPDTPNDPVPSLQGDGVKGTGSDAVTKAQPRPVPRLALTRVEAAASIGVSLDSFERYVQPELRLIRRGRLRLISVAELERWLETNSARVLEEAG